MHDRHCSCTFLDTSGYAGDWFCSEACNKVWQALKGRVAAGSRLLDTPGYSLQVMRGQDTSATATARATNDAIATAQQVSQPS